MIPVHKVILSSANIVKSKNNKNLTTYCSGTPNVTLVYENEQLVSVHKVIHSCACHFCTKLTKQNWFKFTLIVKGEQQNLYRSKFDLLKEPDREKYQLRVICSSSSVPCLLLPLQSSARRSKRTREVYTKTSFKCVSVTVLLCMIIFATMTIY